MLSSTYILVKSVEINIFHVNNRRGALCLSQGSRMGYPACLRAAASTHSLARCLLWGFANQRARQDKTSCPRQTEPEVLSTGRFQNTSGDPDWSKKINVNLSLYLRHIFWLPILIYNTLCKALKSATSITCYRCLWFKCFNYNMRYVSA